MNNKVKDLEKIAFGIGCMFGIYWIYLCFIEDKLAISDGFKSLIGLVTLYVFGFGLFILITKGISVQKREKHKVSLPTILLCFLLQFTAFTIFIVIMNVTSLFGNNSTSTNIDITSPFTLFLLLIFNPIIEELVFRKMFADRLLKHGERFYIFVSSFCFAIVHGVSLGLPQIIYTFILGMIWSYLMVKTGDIKLVIILHALSNLFGGILMQILLSISMVAVGIYTMLLMLFGIVGFVLFLINKKKIRLDNELGLVKIELLKDVFCNRGMLFYVMLTFVAMLVK